MKRIIFIAGATLGLLASFAAERACAQVVQPGPFIPPFSPYQRPGFNPYMNPMWGGNPAMYPVQPQFMPGAAVPNLGGPVLVGGAYGTTGLGPQSLLITGHPVGFLTHRAYFLNTGIGGQLAAPGYAQGFGLGSGSVSPQIARPAPFSGAVIGFSK